MHCNTYDNTLQYTKGMMASWLKHKLGWRQSLPMCRTQKHHCHRHPIPILRRSHVFDFPLFFLLFLISLLHIHPSLAPLLTPCMSYNVWSCLDELRPIFPDQPMGPDQFSVTFWLIRFFQRRKCGNEFVVHPLSLSHTWVFKILFTFSIELWHTKNRRILLKYQVRFDHIFW